MVATYKYDDTGLRTEKTVTENGVTTTTKFVYDSGKLITEYTGTSRVDYLYDENGMLYGFIYNNAKYFYIRDTLQNILGIVDSNGAAVVHYDYTAYGECKAITGSKKDTIGAINSFRYNGYYFDEEAEFFYCKSRFYLSEWCRWINMDNPLYLDRRMIYKMNLLAYCKSDPITFIDFEGTSFKTFWDGVVNFFENAKEWLDKYALNDDGTYSLHDNDRFRDDNPWHYQILAFKPSGPSLDLKEGNIGIGSLSVDVLTGGWE